VQYKHRAAVMLNYERGAGEAGRAGGDDTDMLLVSVTIWEPSLEVTTFCFGFILLSSAIRKALSSSCCLSAVRLCYRRNAAVTVTAGDALPASLTSPA